MPLKPASISAAVNPKDIHCPWNPQKQLSVSVYERGCSFSDKVESDLYGNEGRLQSCPRIDEHGYKAKSCCELMTINSEGKHTVITKNVCGHSDTEHIG